MLPSRLGESSLFIASRCLCSFRLLLCCRSLPASALEESDDEDDKSDDGETPTGEDRDDEKTGTKYSVSPLFAFFPFHPSLPLMSCADLPHFLSSQYTWFHIIFIMASMYVAGLLTDWRVVRPTPADEIPGSTTADDPTDVYIGRSEGAMWMRIVSSWLAVGLYLWSL